MKDDQFRTAAAQSHETELDPPALAELVNNAIMDVILAALRDGCPTTGSVSRRAARRDGYYKAQLALRHMGHLAEQGYVFDGIAKAHDDAGTQWQRLVGALRADIGNVI